MTGLEVDALATDAAVSEAAHGARHTAPPGTPCRNCGTTLKGPYCHACGQKGDDFHRSIWHLASEALEGVTHFDGRVWRTFGRLIARPGQLTREYIEGHRASQLPPFRLFLIIVVLVFFVGSLSVASVEDKTARPPAKPSAAATKKKPAAVPLGGGTTFQMSVKKPGAAREAVSVTGAREEAFDKAVEHWSHQFALLSVLVLAPVVALLFRRRYFFDHLVFSLHSLSLQGAVFTGALLWRATRIPGSEYLFLAIPVHVFFHLHGAYRLTAWGAAWRTVVMLVGQLLGIILLMMGLIVVALAAAR